MGSQPNSPKETGAEHANEKKEGSVSEAPSDAMPATIEVDMLESKESWSEYRLSDGTTLRVKPVMIAVFRADGQQSADGEPVYNTKSTLVMDVRAPSEGRKRG
jgi:hypothetical protein